MFANLTGKQKSGAVILIILCLVAIVLAIYFGVSKRCPVPPPLAPSFQNFNTGDATIPWGLPTYYKYSYYDGTIEGPSSDPSGPIKSLTSTDPVIQVTANKDYTIKIYRAIGTASGDYTLLNVTVDANGEFTDEDNPYIPPPLPQKPPKAPVLIKFHVFGNPWKTPTFYKYSYFDGIQEGPLSESSGEIKNGSLSNPELSVTLLQSYSIKIYRAIDTQDVYSPLDVQVDAKGKFIDTFNPYTPPPPPQKPPKAPDFIDWSVQYM